MDSLSSTDAYHYAMGYTSNRAAQAFAYNRQGFRSSYQTMITDTALAELRTAGKL
jgi:hypothetical protein